MLRKVITIFGILYIPILLLSLYLVYQQKNEQFQTYGFAQNRDAFNKSQEFINHCNSLIRDVHYWSTINYPKGFEPLGKDSLFVKPYFQIINGITGYDQFRFLNLKGQEIFRGERKDNQKLEIAPLQEKKSRQYVIDGLQLKLGQVYLSPIELNKEYGKIEIPYKPVMRAVAPIFDVDYHPLGIVVINFRMKEILDNLKYKVVDNNITLLDSKNRIITSTLYDEVVPFSTGEENKEFEKEIYPQELSLNQDTTLFYNESIWTLKKIDFNHLIYKENAEKEEYIQVISPTNWKLLVQMPKKLLDTILHTFYQSLVSFNIIAVIALLTVSYIFQRSRIQKEKHYNEIEIKNLLLSKRRNELQQTNERILEINNRLETRNKQLSEFNYLVSHNLRAPVTSMAVIVDLMKKEGELLKSNQLLPKLDLITTSLIDFTKDIGDYASLLDEKNIKVEKVNLEKLIEQVKSEFSETLLDSTDFEVMTNLEGWTHVTFSKFYLHSIIQNLLSNAIKYRRGDVKSFIHFETIMENDEKVLLVNDNGLGINLERHGENIFKLYKRFHRNISGKGIGLFLVKSQLEALNANITIESAQEIGTKFKINFKKL